VFRLDMGNDVYPCPAPHLPPSLPIWVSHPLSVLSAHMGSAAV
jgi:hypothetical protein